MSFIAQTTRRFFVLATPSRYFSHPSISEKHMADISTPSINIGEVKSRSYPGPAHTYPMPPEEMNEFERLVELKGV